MSVTGFFLKSTSLRLKEGAIKTLYVPGQQDTNEVLSGNLSIEEALGRAGMVNARLLRGIRRWRITIRC
jgi:hypothetical protein